MPSVLIVEDEEFLAQQLADALEASGHEVRQAGTQTEALELVGADAPDIVVSDLRLPDGSGLDLLDRLQQLDPSMPVILMTAYGSVRDAVEAMRRGARDYLQKPLDIDELRLLVARVLEGQRRDRELAYHRERGRALPTGVVGNATGLQTIFESVRRLEGAGIPPGKRPTILLSGETGTGKGVVARAIHEMLGDGPFLEVNCTAMPAALVEAELFGHERGTFTDAKTSRAGIFEAAAGGTVFLDEIGHVERELQAKFLKVIEEKRIRRLGSTRDRPIDVHVIAATNRDLAAAVQEGGFREDLFHRLSVLSFEIPALRDRAEDIPELARHFCAELGQLYDGHARNVSPEGQRALGAYSWPGNVRELRNVLERAILLEPEGPLEFEALARLLGPTEGPHSPPRVELPDTGVDLSEVERELILQALDRVGGNVTRAARLLGLTRDTLRYRLEKYEMN